MGIFFDQPTNYPATFFLSNDYNNIVRKRLNLFIMQRLPTCVIIVNACLYRIKSTNKKEEKKDEHMCNQNRNNLIRINNTIHNYFLKIKIHVHKLELEPFYKVVMIKCGKRACASDKVLVKSNINLFKM